jgi:hypothetical protein
MFLNTWKPGNWDKLPILIIPSVKGDLVRCRKGLWENNIIHRSKRLNPRTGCYRISFAIAEAENKRLSSEEPDPYHRYPFNTEGNENSRKGSGRPKGFKNRIEKKVVETIPEEKRKRGRPSFSKNKKTIESETQKMENSVKRKPGRPKGSPNKSISDITIPKRSRGRPRKNQS